VEVFMTDRRFMLVAVLLAFASAGCGTSPTDPAPSAQETLADSILMAPGEEASFGAFHLSFLEVSEDSRCAVDVVCIWVGNAAVEIAVSLGDGPSYPKTLNTSDGMPAVDFYDFRVTLLELLPERRAGVPIPAKDYRARFRVGVRGDTPQLRM